MSQTAKIFGKRIDQPTSPTTKKLLTNFMAHNNLKDVKIFFGKPSAKLITKRTIKRMHEAGIKIKEKDKKEVLAQTKDFLQEAKKTRNSFYDPVSNTILMHGNIPEIGLHEIGHAIAYKDENPFHTWSAIQTTFRQVIPGATAFSEGLASYRAWKYAKEKNLKVDTNVFTKGVKSYLPREALLAGLYAAVLTPIIMTKKLSGIDYSYPDLDYGIVKAGRSWQIGAIQS